MVLVPGLIWYALTASDISHSILETIGDPNVEGTNHRRNEEPVGGRVERPGTVVSMGREEAAYGHTPLQSLVCMLVLKNWLELQTVILAWFLVRVIVKEVSVRRLVISDITPTKLMYTFYFIWVTSLSFFEARRHCIALPNHTLLGNMRGWLRRLLCRWIFTHLILISIL